jgi:hypothetical protein
VQAAAQAWFAEVGRLHPERGGSRHAS